jgi:hypothetical protein
MSPLGARPTAVCQQEADIAGPTPAIEFRARFRESVQVLSKEVRMDATSDDQSRAMRLLSRMFEAELGFLNGDTNDIRTLASAFHRDVVVHEPASLPYAGDWRGLEEIGALFRRMKDIWSDMRVDGLQAARLGDSVLMTCTLYLTARANGAKIRQPFAEVLRFEGELLIEGTPFYYDTGEIVAALEQRP